MSVSDESLVLFSMRTYEFLKIAFWKQCAWLTDGQ